MTQCEKDTLVAGNKQGKKKGGTFGKKMGRKYIRGDDRRSKEEKIINHNMNRTMFLTIL